MKDEALKLALKALKRMKAYGNTFGYRQTEQNPHEQVCEAITAIKQALAAQQEPVYHLRQFGDVTKGELLLVEMGWNDGYDAGLGVRQALDKKAANARELGLDYEPVLKDNSNYRYDPPVAEPVQSCYCPNCEAMGKELAALKAQPVQEPVEVDQTTMELAESVRLIGPASRTHDLHAAIQRFHDLICVNATIKAAKMAADAIRESTPPAVSVAWKWHQAPVKTSWGHGMVVADLAIDKDNTVSVYCERDQTAKVEAMFTPPAQPAVPDAFGTREGEHPQYIQGWNDCRAEMLRIRGNT